MVWILILILASICPLMILLQVSRLLAAIFVLSASTDFFSPYLSPCKELSESHWASYFHQASLGTHLNHKLLSSLIGKQKVQDPMDVKVCLWACGFASCLDKLFKSILKQQCVNILAVFWKVFLYCVDFISTF